MQDKVKRWRKYCYLHENQAGRKRSRSYSLFKLSAILAFIFAIIPFLANWLGILSFFGIDYSIFQDQFPGNLISIGRDLIDSTIIQSSGSVTINESNGLGGMPPDDNISPTLIPESTINTVVPQLRFENYLYLPLVFR